MAQDGNRPPTIKVDPRMLLPMIGIFIAPFIGLLYNPNMALGILAICLGVMCWFTLNLSQQVGDPQRRTLRIGAIMNGVMAVAALILLVTRL